MARPASGLGGGWVQTRRKVTAQPPSGTSPLFPAVSAPELPALSGSLAESQPTQYTPLTPPQQQPLRAAAGRQQQFSTAARPTAAAEASAAAAPPAASGGAPLSVLERWALRSAAGGDAAAASQQSLSGAQPAESLSQGARLAPEEEEAGEGGNDEGFLVRSCGDSALQPSPDPDDAPQTPSGQLGSAAPAGSQFAQSLQEARSALRDQLAAVCQELHFGAVGKCDAGELFADPEWTALTVAADSAGQGALLRALPAAPLAKRFRVTGVRSAAGGAGAAPAPEARPDACRAALAPLTQRVRVPRTDADPAAEAAAGVAAVRLHLAAESRAAEEPPMSEGEVGGVLALLLRRAAKGLPWPSGLAEGTERGGLPLHIRAPLALVLAPESRYASCAARALHIACSDAARTACARPGTEPAEGAEGDAAADFLCAVLGTPELRSAVSPLHCAEVATGAMAEWYGSPEAFQGCPAAGPMCCALRVLEAAAAAVADQMDSLGVGGLPRAEAEAERERALRWARALWSRVAVPCLTHIATGAAPPAAADSPGGSDSEGWAWVGGAKEPEAALPAFAGPPLLVSRAVWVVITALRRSATFSPLMCDRAGESA
eukprot:TRINITY_DN8458_c0_g1_i2.p1 TRINITY_DN8458_c0_g1~~TRINITY_DN8458_c0_g1_i2.p1  ORF type:complete len:634 (+),score=128.97 TRINITY_DN8458_c0_g1_i2:93-1904(+)